MNRMLHHIVWLIVVGPIVPLPFIAALEAFDSKLPLRRFIRLFSQMLDFETLSLAWIIGFVPAMLTAMVLAKLPENLYHPWLIRTIFGAIAGAISTVIFACAAAFITPFITYLLPFLLVNGLFSGAVMGLIIPWLPFAEKSA